MIRRPVRSASSLRVRLTGSLAVLSCALVPLFTSSRAAAEPEYPGNLKEVAGMSCVPSCLLCHNDPSGGETHLRVGPEGDDGWARTLGGIAKMDDPAAAKMLLTLSLGPRDTDMDGTPDLDELAKGTDPLIAGALSICAPTYGCGARVAPAPENHSGLALGAGGLTIAAAAYFSRRRRAARRT